MTHSDFSVTPLMEHTWNTVMHSVLGVSSFEASHGLPARSDTDLVKCNKIGHSKMINVADEETHLHCHTTIVKVLSHAKWSPLYHQNDVADTFATSNHCEGVVDRVLVDELEWVMYYDVQLTGDNHITKKSRRQFTQFGVTHHLMGKTF